MSDLHEKVTAQILEQLEKGCIPWQKPWTENSIPLTIPKNATTGNKYRGINIPLLWIAAEQHEFSTVEFASYKQWQGQGEQVAQGQKGTMVIYYDTFEREKETGDTEKVPFIKSSYVFNRCQLSGYEQPVAKQTEQRPLAERIAQADAFVANTKAIIEHRGSKACYIPSQDKILMPKMDSFIETPGSTATENYYSTLAHELTHWSGHEDRCNREISNRFGTKPYAFEELVAEMGAAFLCAELEICHTPKPQHGSYLAFWLSVLKDMFTEDKKAIFKAASSATKSVDFLMAKSTSPEAEDASRCEWSKTVDTLRLVK